MFRDLMRDKVKAMPTDPDPARVRALRVWHCNYVSLAAVAQYPNLSTLVVAAYPDADLEPLASLTSLRYLSLVHLPGVTDLAPLENSTSLVSVRVSKYPKAEVTRFRDVTGLSDEFAPTPGVADWN